MEVGNLKPSSYAPEVVARIHDVGFFSLNSSMWDETASNYEVPPSPGVQDSMGDFNPRDGYTQGTPPPAIFEHPCSPLMKILSSGTFYYALAPHWDITSRLSRRVAKGKQATPFTSYDQRFLWNEYIVQSLLDFREKLDSHEQDELDQCQFIVSRSPCGILDS